MTIVHSFKYDKENPSDCELRQRLQDVCNQVRNFFEDDELKIVRYFQEWVNFDYDHVDKLLTTLYLVAKRIENRQSHQAFPEELKKRYLVSIYALIERFRLIEADIRPELEPCNHDATYPFNGHTTCMECKTILD